MIGEPVRCSCGDDVAAYRIENGWVECQHGAVGAGYSPIQLRIIGDGDEGAAVVRVLREFLAKCPFGGERKPFADILDAAHAARVTTRAPLA